MERLPSEIQHLIFAKTNHAEQCRLVCKNWYAMITEDLLHRFALLHNEARIAFYENRPDLGKHVRGIFAILTAEKAFTLPRLFSNLQYLDLTVYTLPTRNSATEFHNLIQTLDGIPHWTSSIRSIKERNHATPLFTSLWLEAAAAAAGRGALANLTDLHIKMFDYREFNRNNIEMQKYITQKHQFLHSLRLANTLRRLTLEEMYISWEDLDAIHDRVPDLRSLSFINVKLQLNENIVDPHLDIQQRINQASSLPNKQVSSLKHLKIDLHAGNGSNGSQPHELIKVWAQQIASKYTDLISFTLQSDITMQSRDFKPEHTLSLLPMMVSCQRLTALEIMLYPITQDLLVAMDRNNIKLRTLRFDTTNNVDLKKQLSLLSDSDQSNHLQHLKLHSNYPGGHYEYTQKRALQEESQGFDTRLFQSLSNFARLKTLEFNCAFGRSCDLAHLIQILAYCKSLRSLHLDHVSVSNEMSDILLSPVTVDQFPQLEHLTITKLNIKRDSQALVDTNLILKRVLQGLQNSLETIYLELGSITFGQNKVDHPLADYLYLDLSTLQELRRLSVNYALGSSTITTERGEQCETHEFGRNNHVFNKVPPPPPSQYQTKVILPQQAIKINTRLVL